MNVLFIPISAITSNSVIEYNVDQKLLSKTLLNVQDTELKPILGDDLYNDLVTNISSYITGGTIDNLYLDIVSKSKQFLVNRTVSNFLIINQYKITNKGVMLMNDNSSSNISSSDLSKLQDYYNNLSSRSKYDLIKWLNDNKLIPTDGSVDTNITDVSTGWYLGTEIECDIPVEDYDVNKVKTNYTIYTSDNRYTYQQLSELNKVLIISSNDVKTGSVIEDNTDDKVLSRTIQNVQSIHLKPILTDNLYFDLLDSINSKVQSGTTIDPVFQDMLVVIKPYLINKVVSEFIQINQYKISDKGVMTMNDDSSSNITSGDLLGLKQYYDNLVITYQNDLVQFLSKYNIVIQDNDNGGGVFFGIDYSDECNTEYNSNVNGPRGFSGLSGLSGGIGTIGLSGISGSMGSSGISGLSGSGPSGISGSIGISGISGLVGPIGSSGLSGLIGISGLSGLSGLKGDSISYQYYAEYSGTPTNSPSATGISSIAIGDGAQSNSDNQLSFGTDSGFDSVGDNSNSIFLGYQAGYQSTGMTDSNLIGEYAGYQGLNSYYSTFIGYNSGANSDDIQYSYLIGENSGDSSSTIDTCLFIGYGSGNNTSNISESNFIGDDVGYKQSGVTYSNLIGYRVGRISSSDQSIGSNNIIIGTNITLPSGSTDMFNIGNVLYGLNTNNITTGFSISTPQTSGKLGLNTFNPRSAFEIYGSSNSIFTGLTLTNAGSNLNSGVSLEFFNKTGQAGQIANITATVGSSYVNNTLDFGVQGSNRLRIFGATGNVSINKSTDDGYRMDVSGTTRSNSVVVSDKLMWFGSDVFQPGNPAIPIFIKSPTTQVSPIAIGGWSNPNILTYTSSSVSVGMGNNYWDSIHTIMGRSNTISSPAIGVVFGSSNSLSTNNGFHLVFGSNNVANSYTNGQIADIVFGSGNNTNGYWGGGLFGSGLKYYANSQLAFGHNSDAVNFAIKDIYFGYGVKNEYVSANSGNGPNISINTSWSYSGINQNGGNITINGGKGTGTGTPGDVILATANKTTSGTTYQTYTNRLTVKGDTGQVGIGTSTPNSSAKVQIDSTTSGFLPPRMTGTQAEAISSPAEGLLIYSTDGSGTTITSKGWWGYDGSTWNKLN